MPVGIKMYVTGDQQVSAFISNLADRAKDLGPALKEARLTMLNSVERNFQSGGRPVPWRPLALSTLRQKLRNGGSPLPLTGASRKTRSGRHPGGQLRRSISALIVKADKARLIIGTVVKYARIHQRGGRAGKNHSALIPARPYLVFQEKDLEHIGRALVLHVRGK